MDDGKKQLYRFLIGLPLVEPFRVDQFEDCIVISTQDGCCTWTYYIKTGEIYRGS